MAEMKITTKGFDKLVKAMRTDNVRRKLKRNVGLEVKKSAKQFESKISDYIRSERHGVPNSPLTILAKGKSKPLVDTGELQKSIETDYHATSKALTSRVGVASSKRNRDGDKISPIALALHNGAVIKVTPQVRAAVFASIRDRTRAPVDFTEGEGKKTWILKGRPFIKVPFDEFDGKYKRNVSKGVKRAIEKL